MRRITKIFSFAPFVLLMFFVISVALAQTDDPSASQNQETLEVNDDLMATDDSESVISTDDILVRPRQTEEILRLRELYRDQVERYRTLEREFSVNKNQYAQLQTLQSLEKAVVSTREVLLIRGDVLITYFELMRASLEDTEGIDLVQKKEIIDKLIDHITVLKEHRTYLELTVTREGVAQRVAEYAAISQEFESTSYRALALITIGDIQTVYDKARILYDEVLLYHEENPVSVVKQQERNRAYTEASREIERIGLLLRDIRQKYSGTAQLKRDNYDRELGNTLNAAYGGTKQIVFYLRELFLELT